MIHIYCDGGLGNRLLMLFSSLCFIKNIKKPFIIHWPCNNWCGCNFNDLFDNDYNTTNFDLKFVDTHVIQKCTLLLHENQINHKANNIIYNVNLSKESIIDLFRTESDILYYGNGLHASLNYNDLIESINSLQISKNIIDKISKYNVNDYYGVHIRGTDFPEAPFITIDQLEKEITTNKDKKYFICSDEKEIEDIFKTMENITIFKKTSYVERLDKTKEWQGKITDNLNRSFNFNVNRKKQSVIEGFCDMLLLSKTKLVKTSNSSFLKCAYALSKKQV